VFAELYRKTRQLEQLNADLERRVAERTAELEASNARLRESERRRSLALAAGQMGSWDWDVSTGTCQWDSGQYRIFGVEPGEIDMTLDGVRPLIHPEDLERILKIVRKGAADGNTFQTEVRILRPDGQTRWCICAAAMSSDEIGRITRINGVTIDITELKEAEARRTLLVQEVDHRARNALAIVQSIVRLTKATTTKDYMALVEGRIKALSSAHALLAESRWEGADLRRLVDEEVAPYRNGGTARIAPEGPPVFLKPATAQIIALVLHELATNAAKYGALSEASGGVSLRWTWSRGQLDMIWEESGGPPVRAPTTKGYGTKVISTSVTRQLGGTADFDWRPDGLRFVLSLAAGEQQPEPATTQEPDMDDERPALPGGDINNSGRSVLLVEDEALVGLMMKDFLTNIGFNVVGPFGKVAEAFAAVGKEHQLQAAVLDINLRGETIYPLADELTSRGVSIVFVTGYGPEAIDRRFANVPVLQKPVDNAVLQQMLNAH
jgi:PAS domain S-box-containing protein